MPLSIRIAWSAVGGVGALWLVFAIALWHRASLPWLSWGLALVLALGLLVVMALVVASRLRDALRPIDRTTQVLSAWTQGDLHPIPCARDLARADAAGQLARCVAALRIELLDLHVLREQRGQQRSAQAGLIRQQLRLLAASLGDDVRADILRALDTASASHGAGSVADDSLAEITSILARMAGLVSTQQGRLVGLLRELHQAMSHQTVLAGLQQELEIARNMQLSILPRHPPPARDVEVAALMIPAREVGGDFYDYFMIDDDHLAFVVADVSGKGIPAAFFMAISRTLFKSNAMFLREPARVVARLNDQLCAENEQMMFVTAFFAVLDLRSGALDFVNAGHNPPVLRDCGAAVSLLPSNQNAALAVVTDVDFTPGRVQMRAGDTLLLYTDGITEAHDPGGRLFGEGRLLDTVMAHGGPADLPSALLRQVRRFEGGIAQADDITCVAIRYTPQERCVAFA